MTAPFDPHLPADPPVRAEDPRSAQAARPGAPAPGPYARTAEQAARIAARREERTALWKAVQEAGGIAAWVRAELANKGVSTEGIDPSALGDAYRVERESEGSVVKPI